MSERRLLGEHFNPRGRPKLAFNTRADALAHARGRHQDGRLVPYRCSFCSAWHLATNHRLAAASSPTGKRST